MRTRIRYLVVTLLALGALLASCGAKARVGTFVTCETRPTDKSYVVGRTPGTAASRVSVYDVHYLQERTGNVLVRLEDGRTVVCECPYNALSEGQRVVLEDAGNGSFVVTDLASR